MISRTFRATSLPEQSRGLAKEVVGFLNEYISDSNILHDLDIMLTEACANVVRHAYGGVEGVLEVRLRVEPGVFVDLEIVDWGRGFGDGARFENPGPESEGGRGLFIISMLSDVVEVRTDGLENIVAIRKQIGKNAWKS
ncbi:ATP-binding protein [Desulfolutivibrio sulfoxidireducens]|uniref:ATP-binding protein n=1 Tax=Desulfolutivibrio sulfoxidireducens TaxID=2773299 RepID=UPI00159E8713|nr:ATP-binding protein [Desulfolutivibrio sulfoxidireducens]QLA16766.1 ATP-binding protein [Desulfolutivibrio sulfoxidireducens]QLA20330.1 ATP-binding protein [Desulfolutivibrio sulfoxidireducens]